MVIILSHRQQDFDSLASMVAVQKLYPDSIMVMDGKANPYVEEFLALSRDQLPLKRAQDIDLDSIEQVILVDTHDLQRAGEIGKKVSGIAGLPLIIYDHHPCLTPVPEGATIEPVGACVTLLVEQLMAKGMLLSGFEATLMALGIYEDTGSLLFETTTVRDMQAAAYLLEQGSNLGVVAEYLRKPLTEEQKDIFHQLLDHGNREDWGNSLFISWAECPDYVGGLALVAHRVVELEGADTAFFVVMMENRVYLIGRSRGKGLAVNQIVKVFGGAGHERAASAVIKGQQTSKILEELKEVIGVTIKAPNLVKDMMSYPVKTIEPGLTLQEAEQVLLRYEHTGVPVKEGDKLMGIISRRDVEKALKHGLGHAPVKGFMSTKLVTAEADAPWESVQRLMVAHDVGRIPVMEKGRLVGIVSRSDVLRSIHGQAVPVEGTLVHERSQAMRQDIIGLIERLEPKMRKIVEVALQAAEEGRYAVFIVGGFVRDLLLLKPTQDLDLVVEGDGTRFALDLAHRLPEGQLTLHEQFGTARLDFSENVHVDIACARREYYPYPGALPQVEESSLRQDLFRRDFTINTMAISLHSSHFAYGELIDYYGGYGDLRKGKIRFLHNLSFVDDPTRMVRAVRFAGRYTFTLATETGEGLETALKNGMLRRLSSERFTEELLHVFAEDRYDAMGESLVELGILENWFGQKLPWCFVPDRKEGKDWPLAKRWLMALGTMTDDAVMQVIHNLTLPKKLREITDVFIETRKTFLTMESLDLLTADEFLYKKDRIIAEALSHDPRLVVPLNLYLKALSRYRPVVDGKKLIEMGVESGPLIGEILSRLRKAWLTETISSEAEETHYAKELLENLSEH